MVLYGANLAALACINAVLWLLVPRSEAPARDRADKVSAPAVALFFVATLAPSFQSPEWAERAWCLAFLAPLTRAAVVRRARAATSPVD